MRGALRDLVPFVQFKKREKHPWKSVNFSKVAGQRTTYILYSPFSYRQEMKQSIEE